MLIVTLRHKNNPSNEIDVVVDSTTDRTSAARQALHTRFTPELWDVIGFKEEPDATGT